MNSREKYWATQVPFPCPIDKRALGGLIVDDCFKHCHLWRRNYVVDAETQLVVPILYCAVDPSGERELHSGKPTRPDQ